MLADTDFALVTRIYHTIDSHYLLKRPCSFNFPVYSEGNSHRENIVHEASIYLIISRDVFSRIVDRPFASVMKLRVSCSSERLINTSDIPVMTSM